MKNIEYPLYQLPKIRNIADMIQQKAFVYREKIAFIYHKDKNELKTKTFDDVFLEVSRLAGWMNEKYPKGTRFAIIGENSYEWLIAFLSAVSSGNVAVPIDKDLSNQEIANLIKRVNIDAIFCSTAYIEILKEVKKEETYVLNNVLQFQPKIEENNKMRNDLGGEDLACIFFTSGTSGTSKGVMLSQNNLTAEINNTCQLFKLEGSTLSVLPFHHAFGLIVGVLMVFNYGYPNFLNKSLKQIGKDLILAKPQTMFLVPLFVENFYKKIQDGVKKSGEEKTFKVVIQISNFLDKIGIHIKKKLFKAVLAPFGGNLTYIISGGAMLDPFYVKEFRNIGIEILNGYGTTECSPCTAVNRNLYHKDGTVGVLIPGAKVRIAEDGEVLISGPHVMMGYYNDPLSTSEVLKEGWYYTGDLGNIDNQGFITLTGRKKNLIILSNGENISPEELESIILLDSAVQETLVYELDGKIVAEIYPIDEYQTNQEYFDKLIKKVNFNRPMYKQIASVRLRNNEFIKNSSKKIVRYKNIQEVE